MMYHSTRGMVPALGFDDVLLTGLAPDGGLYVPEAWTKLSLAEIASLGGRRYQDQATAILSRFTAPDFEGEALARVIEEAYATFEGPDIAPLAEIGPSLHLLELFHGPTFAFKDFAMQVLARMMDRALAKRGRRATILGATSGDTGAAAVEAFRGRSEIDVFILFPNGRVSDIQRRQMTTAEEDNIHAIAIDGTFDDAQSIVKTLFGDAQFSRTHGLSAINSINWARIMAQAVYYFAAVLKLEALGKPVSFSVPTGNFGDIFAGYVASRMGLPITRLIVATNENDILTRALGAGRYEPRGVVATDSPSMDIQVSSNFERLLFEASGRDAEFVRDCMARLSREGGFDLPPAVLSAMRAEFAAFRASRDQAAAAMPASSFTAGIVLDPHTAVGLAAAMQYRETGAAEPVVVLGTAHPAKFPDAVMRATGAPPETPARLEKILKKKERYIALPNNAAVVADYIAQESRFTSLAHV